MHNQDQTKDDFMESIMAIMDKIVEHYRKQRDEKIKEEVSEETKEVVYDDDKIIRFQKVMKEIIKETDKTEIKSIAQTFHDNPVESMKMLQALVSEQTVEESKELVKMTKETTTILEEIRNNINVSDPKAVDQLAALNHLVISENKKMQLAQNILDDVRPLDKENGINDLNKEPKEIKVEETKDIEMDGPER